MSVDEIEQVLPKLSAAERARPLTRLEEMAAAEWDRQIEADAKSGKLDKLFEGAMDDLRAGRVKKL